MIEGRPSRTAMAVAMRRAAHQVLDAPLILNDPLAFRILGPELETRVRSELGSRHATRLGRILRAFLAVRARLAEDLLAEAVAAGVTQFVVLGAGLDTFAYRNPHPGLRVFEVDFPATQEWKRNCLKRAGIAVPGSVIYAPCDFTKQSAADALRAAGLDDSQRSFCSWLGVSMYLKREAVLATVRAMLPIVRAPGGLIFDYLAPSSTLPLMRRMIYTVARPLFAWRVARSGEPFLSEFAPDELTAMLRELGARDAVNYSPDALRKQFLNGRTDGLRLGSVGHIALVRG